MSKSASTPSSSASVLEVQHQIRANASQLQDYFSDLYSWEKSINQEEAARKKHANATARASTPAPRQRVQQTVVAPEGDVAEGVAVGKAEAAAHTYDRGYSKWAKFDVVSRGVGNTKKERGCLWTETNRVILCVFLSPNKQEAALREADGDESSKSASPSEEQGPLPSTTTAAASKILGPKVVIEEEAKPKSASTKRREDIEREEGNAHYQRGDYVAAIKCYTRCLGYNSRNAVVLSNRAMAYLKSREFGKAEDDCNLALRIDPSHLKSLSRRGTARNSLGKHRLALLDFERAAELDPKSRQIQTQMASTRELIRTSIKRAPKRTQFSIEVIGESTKASQEPRVEKDAENKENSAGNNEATAATVSKTVQRSALSENPGTLSQRDQPQPEPTSAANPAPTPSPSVAILPKLPKKAPTTAYEFGRVWKTLALKGGAERRKALLDLRADYLRLLQPSALRTVFKNSIESDILCETFHVFRHAMQTRSSDKSFVLEFAKELTKIPRFSMTVMFLSDREKEDIVWVLEQLSSDAGVGNGENHTRDVKALKELYELE